MGSQVLWNFTEVFLDENLIFSNLRKSIRSQSHCEVFGGYGDFQLINILLLARRDAKAKASLILFGIFESVLINPNKHNSKLGTISRSNTSDKQSVIANQKLDKTGEGQNTCIRPASAKWQWSHSSSIPCWIFGSFTLQKWTLWRTLNWIRLSWSVDYVYSWFSGFFRYSQTQPFVPSCGGAILL